MIWMNKMNLPDIQNTDVDVIYGECEASPNDVGYDSERLKYLNGFIQSLIDEGLICSGSYCLCRYGKVFADNSVGTLALEWMGHNRFAPETLFEIQSVGKLFTAVAVLKLYEDGLLSLEHYVKNLIPEFDVDGFNEITIQHLLTHTSGICALDGFMPEDVRNWEKYINESDSEHTWISAVIKAGLHARPGEKWIYSVAGYYVLGEIIRRTSGMEAEEYIRRHIFTPCEMFDTHWRIDANPALIERYNIANETDLDMVRKSKSLGIMYMANRTYKSYIGVPETAGGQMSTCRDMIKFGQMILQDGIYNGKRVIGKKALSLLYTNLLNPGTRNVTFGKDEAIMYGAGAAIYSAEYDKEQFLTEGTMYHEGAGTSVFLVDREKNFTACFQTSFRKEFDWDPRAVKDVASIIWSGII